MHVLAAYLGMFATGAAVWFGRWDYVAGCLLLTMASIAVSPHRRRPKR
jgi:hypothetical protein